MSTLHLYLTIYITYTSQKQAFPEQKAWEPLAKIAAFNAVDMPVFPFLLNIAITTDIDCLQLHLTRRRKTFTVFVKHISRHRYSTPMTILSTN